MKKYLLSLMALVSVALSAFAEETPTSYAFAYGTYTSGQVITQGDVTMTLATSDTWAYKAEATTVNGRSYTGCITNKENPDLTKGTGAYATFETSKNGTL